MKNFSASWCAFTAVISTILLLSSSDAWAFSRNKKAISQDPRTEVQIQNMIEQQIRRRGIQDSRVLQVMSDVPRHEFVPKDLQSKAYQDGPLPIGFDQTISQPYIVAFMSEAAQIQPESRVLEIGTGSGYQTAILSHLAKEVYSIEILQGLATQAQQRFQKMNLENIQTRVGDGYQGWPQAAPFDVILVTAAPSHVPPALLDQLKVGGRLIIPVGESFQKLLRITKMPGSNREESRFVEEKLLPVRFVPMTGQAQKSQ